MRKKGFLYACGFLFSLFWIAASPARSEVTRVEIKSRAEVSGFDYVKILGRIYFAVTPGNPHNRIIVDLDKAKRADDGRVEFSADFFMLTPKSNASGTALVDIVNRGGLTAAASFSDKVANREIGDGFLLKRGITIVAVGWEFDVPATPGSLRLEAPISTENGRPLSGLVRAEFIPDGSGPQIIRTLGGYTPLEPTSSDSVLTVRDDISTPANVIPREQWSISSNNTVTLHSGFEPGRLYEISYRTANWPIAGLGFAAVRDTVSWLRGSKDSIAPIKFAYAFGASQSGRFLREFLYEGFNSDENGARVFDGVLAHIAGSGRIDLNSRWSTPVECCSTNSTSFPFATSALLDPVSGLTDGLLENGRARANQPKLFLTNSGVEYWSSAGRAAALTHTTPDGKRDVKEAGNVRIYFFAGTQHGPGAFPPVRGAGQQLLNPTNYSWVMRALLVAMDRWVRNGVAPPASQHPRVDRGTLVDVNKLAFPAIPGVQSPRNLKAGFRVSNQFLKGGAGFGTELPLLVPRVDADGNERSGIRVPEIAVPLATYTGWNFRAASVGRTTHLYPLIGSYIPFARTEAERNERNDPRLSVAERYSSRDAYMAKIREAADKLVKQRYLLAEDLGSVVARAAAHYELIMRGPEPESR